VRECGEKNGASQHSGWKFSKKINCHLDGKEE
jgi:hypothetical protein